MPEAAVILIVLLILVVPLVLAIWLIARAVHSRDRIEELSRRVGGLEVELHQLKSKGVETTAEPEPTQLATSAQRVVEKISENPPALEPLVTPPVIPTLEPAFKSLTAEREIVTPTPILPRPATSAAPPPLPSAPKGSSPAINWEQFMGVRLFAWVGGLALFFGVAFFVKYSFENNLISPQMRVTIGFIVGLGLIVGGVIMSRRNYAALSQTLCATGVLILYAVTFACRSFYHFEFFKPLPTFVMMGLITTVAFFLAVRLNALVVAILGMLGGFLTPILLSTGVDNPLGLFGYIAILDVGLMVVALNRRWFFLTALAACGTALMQIAWAARFFTAEKYYEGNKILIALAVLLGFCVLYLAAAWFAKGRREQNPDHSPAVRSPDYRLSGSTLGLVAVALAFTAWFLDFAPLAQRPWLMFGFVLLLDLIVTALSWLDEELSPAQSVAGFAIFCLLGFWTNNSLTDELLTAALVFYFAFAVFHSALPALLQRTRGLTRQIGASHFFPIIALALVLVPVFKFAEVSFIVWPFILLVDVLAIVLAAVTATLLPVLAVLVLTLAATGALIFKLPADVTEMPPSFFLIGGFAVFFVAVSTWLIRKFKPDAFKTGVQFGNDITAPQDLAVVLSASSAALPFLLLIMATLRLHLVNPTPVFGLALLLVVLLLGVTRLFSLDWLPAIGLACVTALECAWHFNRFDPDSASQSPNLLLAWYLVFYAVFAVFPFLFLKRFSDKVVPWAAAALAGLPQFFLVYRLVKVMWPNEFMGLLPAGFAIPPLMGLAVVLKKIPAPNPARLTQLAWFGGVALFFITLIFPIQFERQWITVGWAAEGAALLWLFHRVPHPGLRLTGVGLLIAAFVRLAFNLAVFDYQTRGGVPIWNWYLYTYGIVTMCLFLGARLLAPPRNQILGISAPPILRALGTVLAFVLMNIEIADYFTAPGARVQFQFGGNFAREMTYTIAWALFALVLIVVGIARRIPASRYTALALLSVTLLKLFFHDLANLSQLYRIGAFIGVAVIAMLASFAYQRFFTVIQSKDEPRMDAEKHE